MLSMLWDTRHYFFWLMAISLFCWLLERLLPWREDQKVWRDQFAQDLFWLVFNGYYAGLLVATGAGWVLQQGAQVVGGWPWQDLQAVQLLTGSPLWVQFAVLLVLKDLLEWCVHRLLHRVAWLWQFHKLHHSIAELDWIGNMRFHWMETIVYKSVQYIPLAMIGFGIDDFILVHIFTILIGHLNHANLNWSYGPLRYIFNNPKMHIWHHSKALPASHPYGINFGLSLSVWDYLFGTAHIPHEGRDIELGFEGDHNFPKGFLRQVTYPLFKVDKDH